jgi:CRISPR/Cas system CMR subunit Cmr6 (Cas7 group RAMP superfamily)
MTKKPLHTFHIPVMGLAYTIDSPIRVAQYGISSVISIADDDLIEKMRSFYSTRFNLPYEEITQKFYDYRAERITSYLNLVDKIVKQKFESFKKEITESKTALESFITMLPNTSEIRKGLQNLLEDGISFRDNIQNYIESQLFPGDIDVNIMTKLDKDNFVKNEHLPVEFNDAHAALRGFANSNLESSVILSAGMNPRLYSYFENFSDFFPDENNQLRKKIILKVSDFRSAMIQGNFLAKKGLWVSEYRIESGLNCGGHAFATDGLLLGTILEEFKQKKGQLIQSAHELLTKALQQKNGHIPDHPLELKITVQGGIGTAEEHEFLLDNYHVDSVGWGSPFLLVPEATCVDYATRNLLINAKEEDLYLSHISPLGIPFNTLKGTTNEILKQKRIQENKAGSSCPKKFLALSKEYGSHGICTASKKYQDIKLAELEKLKSTFSIDAFEKSKIKITEKSCLCVGLANSSYLENDIKIKGQAQGVVICPGPNMAYFDQEVSLKDMVQHIYGSKSVLRTATRPHMFVKELKMYIDYFRNEIENIAEGMTISQFKKWNTYKMNVLEGIEYYQNLFLSTSYFKNDKEKIKIQFDSYKSELNAVQIPLLKLD